MGVLLIFVLIAVAVVFSGILGGKGGTSNPPVAQAPTPVPEKTVVVLSQPVKRGTVLNESQLSVITIPESSFIPDMMFDDTALVVGTKAKFDLDSGMILTKAVLLTADEALPLAGSDAALVIPPGKVAVSIPISRLSAVSYAPRRGDHVDVIATLLLVDLDTDFQTLLPDLTAGVVSPGNVEYQAQAGSAGEIDNSTGLIKGSTSNLAAQVVGGGRSAVLGRTEIDPVLGQPFYILPSEAQRPRMVSQSILRDVIVLQVGNFLTAEEEAAAQNNNAGSAAATGAEPGTTTGVPGQDPTASQQNAQTTQTVIRPPDVITLIVSPQDAVTLNYLIYGGAELTLALRSAATENNDVIPTQPVTLQYIMDTYNIPMPARQPYGLEPKVQDLMAPELPNDKPLPTPAP
ncbi:MAG: hypothetical protein Fur0018_12950 [Anaerolineales bacterium]